MLVSEGYCVEIEIKAITDQSFNLIGNVNNLKTAVPRVI